jgi:hypothetical protein
MNNLKNIDFGSGVNRTYNIVAVGALGLSILCACIFFIMLIIPAPAEEVLVFPTQIQIPTEIPTEIPTITRTPLPATFTPTFTPTPTVTFTPTIAPTLSPTTTITFTPTITTTVFPTETFTVSPTPTATLGTPATSPPPFLFDTQGAAQFVQNTFNSAGCAWQGIGGQVFNLSGQSYNNPLVVRVFGGGLPVDQTARTGDNTSYGASGFEVQVANGITTATYFVQLESEFGTAVSDRIEVRFPGDCSGNVALINFQQLREP